MRSMLVARRLGRFGIRVLRSNEGVSRVFDELISDVGEFEGEVDSLSKKIEDYVMRKKFEYE